MTGRTIVRRAAWWLITGFLLSLLVSIITQLVTHHSGQTAAWIAVVAYAGVTALFGAAYLLGRATAAREVRRF